MTIVESCQTCRYFRDVDVSAGHMWGMCHRRSPRPSPGGGPEALIWGVWPGVAEGDWCGEWELAASPLSGRAKALARRLVQALK